MLVEIGPHLAEIGIRKRTLTKDLEMVTNCYNRQERYLGWPEDYRCRKDTSTNEQNLRLPSPIYSCAIS